MGKNITMPKSLAIIPARGGSKGIPRKNIKLLAGKPLIAWSIETARNTSCLDRIIVSTDDPEIAEVAREWGAETPFLRPESFALDDTPDKPVYQHALNWLAENEGYCPEIVVWLRPTSPLRRSENIAAAVEKLIDTGADWVRSVCLVEHHPYWMYRLDGDVMQPLLPEINIADYLRRQLLPPAYRLNGAVDVTWTKNIIEQEILYSGDMRALVMEADQSVDIDTPIDFVLAEAIISKDA